jgi:hypothetical protein
MYRNNNLLAVNINNISTIQIKIRSQKITQTRQIDNKSVHEITIVSSAVRRFTFSGSRARTDEETVDEEHAEGRTRAVVRAHFPETWFTGTRAGLRSPASVRRHRSPSIRCTTDEGTARRKNDDVESESVFRESNEPREVYRIQDVCYIYIEWPSPSQIQYAQILGTTPETSLRATNRGWRDSLSVVELTNKNTGQK